ncbi:hypothetical protein GCM10010254_09920 [Streptomyces chromofuscus]|nr:hypothetical protein GCM10010254_09920 [Streptomyces chromofuscus]
MRDWVDGWVLSCGAAPPVAEPWGWTVDVGLAEHVTRQVLGGVDDAVEEDTVRKVAGSVTGAGVRLKVFADPARVGGLLGPGWWVDPEPGCLMTRPLGPADDEPDLPAGYRLRTWARGGVTRVLIAAPDGSWAARGQVAPTGATAVVNRIETSPDHRRKGLGSRVVRHLQRAAAEQGAETGIPAGTPTGRALYESLGWTVRAPLTSAKFTGLPGPGTRGA